MIVERPYYCLAHITLEALSAHGIHSGQGDATHDVLLVRDANGLPALPGSSLAGVLRHAYCERHGQDATGRLFGQIGEQAQPSWLSVGWGLVHDSLDRPCEGLLDDKQRDPLLELLANSKPLVRQRVRLEHTGAASDQGKFDVTLIPAGVRYTAWLGYWCDDSEESRRHWKNLLALLGAGSLLIGHGVRSGNGHFEVSELAQACWDLRTPQGRQAYVARPRSRRDHQGLQALETALATTPVQIELQLRAEAGWRVGGGERSLGRHEKTPDLLPQHELRVHWENGQAVLSRHFHLLPGSALKGALRHRVAYHYRCLSGDFAGLASSPAPEDCPAVAQLFGQAKDNEGTAGLLLFHDLHLEDPRLKVLMHNRIDRFTGGVIDGALFSEEVLWQTEVTLRIGTLHPQRLATVDALARQALQRALEDLAGGWLPLGANGSRGLGIFSDPTGQGPRWSDQGQWINGAPAMEVDA
ncbi:RAMP superfamily CRISPR-associated protein [Azotobacter vinelandii]|uniref:RAMP superfamily CRISPR-associated protein n=1 Tax=Azotobacter vinelandii TaxID=354 RepID=UPI0026665BFB|nr:RAMP superfamily CRISPR-associated protein [Azotobacter vinelandii]WKN24020.1 RAMP superfamily CRISPR-associated protein [Azotobacter vinelandii]